MFSATRGIPFSGDRSLTWLLLRLSARSCQPLSADTSVSVGDWTSNVFRDGNGGNPDRLVIAPSRARWSIVEPASVARLTPAVVPWSRTVGIPGRARSGDRSARYGAVSDTTSSFP